MGNCIYQLLQLFYINKHTVMFYIFENNTVCLSLKSIIQIAHTVSFSIIGNLIKHHVNDIKSPYSAFSYDEYLMHELRLIIIQLMTSDG